ncbi:protein tic 214 [Phtheirospermum japonicum]|uniref:Protein tic 214 n=1 Tax=Phtheirospermum japonicum TaxID=374723 RepID=A0A830BW85_9LAMI|nr:protein tic 214 [Phtheirospermum japonicum]
MLFLNYSVFSGFFSPFVFFRFSLFYYRYDLLSYKFLDYENKTECFFYRSPFQGNKNQGVSYTSKETLLDMPRNIPINNYLNNNLGRVDTLNMEKMADRKYFDWKILNFYLKQKVDIEAWTMIDTNRNQNIQIITNNSQIISKKDLSYLTFGGFYAFL